MKKIFLVLLLLVSGFAQADQFRIWYKTDKTIQRFTTYYVGSGFTLNGFKKEYKGCEMLKPKAFFKRENLQPHPHVVAAFYCENATYVIADDWHIINGKD